MKCVIIFSSMILLSILFISIPQVFAHDFTDKHDWQTDYVKYLITMDPPEPILGEPVTISCDGRSDKLPKNLSARLDIINVDNYRDFLHDDDTATVLFHTDQLIRVSCYSVMTNNPSHEKLESSYEFHPLIHNNPVIIPYKEPSFVIVSSDQTDNTSSDDDSQKRPGGGCIDCTPPTLGYNNAGVKKVDNGVCINDSCMDGGYFHTEYPMQNTTINYPNIISTTYYENGSPSNVHLVQLGIGVKEIGSAINDSQVLIEVYIDYFANDMENPTIQEINVIDPDGIINNATATVHLVPCMIHSDATCLKTDFKYSYAKVPTSAVLVSNAIDYDNNTVNNYFNDGLRVADNSIVDTIDIIDSTIPSYPKCTTTSTQADRNNQCHFQLLLNHEINKAQKYLDSLK